MVDESETLDEALGETLGGSLEDIRAFCAVAEFGTVSAAARLLSETKGSTSRRLARLERRLGVRLLARTPRAVSLTEEGTAFYTKAREALTWLDDAADSARQSQAVPRGNLRITAPVDFGMDILPELVVRFRALHPQITIEQLLTDTALDLAANRIDLALRATPGALPDMGYRAAPIVGLRVRLYAAPAYVAARGTPATPAELSQHDLIAAREPAAAAQLALTNRRGRVEHIAVRPALRTTDYASALRLTVAGGGIAAIPDLVAARSMTNGAVVPVLPHWRIADNRLHAISLGGRNAPARVRVFLDFVRRELTRDET